jgi:hypothetical protein
MFCISQELQFMNVNLLQRQQEYKQNNGKVTKYAVTYVSFICKVSDSKFISFASNLILSAANLMK